MHLISVRSDMSCSDNVYVGLSGTVYTDLSDTVFVCVLYCRIVSLEALHESRAYNASSNLQIAGDERFSKVIQTLKQKAKLEEPVSRLSHC